MQDPRLPMHPNHLAELERSPAPSRPTPIEDDPEVQLTDEELADLRASLAKMAGQGEPTPPSRWERRQEANRVAKKGRKVKRKRKRKA